MPPTDDSETFRQYTRCYIMLLIGGYLMTDKFNNLVHIATYVGYRFSRTSGSVGCYPGARLCWPGRPVTLFGGTAGRHGHRQIHFTVDELDLSEISSVVST
ncbi:hypothetical protein Ahy_A07g031890 [Arachis hypogaea]|uniref:Uncharacterized protein n=1 Tax=Arachis hypogaea TaxID=3818 RepID=A0A445C5H1_ARAHY|nr:hypothetical protein Ahy_A07g031890 [Arachis hypogaea]